MDIKAAPLVSFLKNFARRIETVSSEDCSELLVILRTLRRGCVSNTEFQTEAGCVLSDLHVILTYLSNTGQDDILNVGLQAVGNLIVQHKENQTKAWEVIGSFVRSLLKSENNKLCYVSSMILYNVLLGVQEKVNIADTVSIIKDILPYKYDGPEFSVFTVELLITLKVTENVYEELDKESRLHLLDTIFNMIVEEDKSGHNFQVPLSSILFLVEQLKRRNFYILKTSNKYADLLDPCEVLKLLEIIAAASSREPFLEHLQHDRSLLIDCTYVLKSVHMAGKAGNPEHRPLTQLSEISDQIRNNASTAGASDQVTNSPTFNLKSTLIRLLGNLCWKNKVNQDEVREMDGIPLLLDCCHIDARNPLLIQWVVLAVRNLCENNHDNQAVIAAMNRKGVVESRLLHELGLTLNEESDGKSIRVVPLKK